MSKLLNVSSSPHVRNGVSTKNIMYDVAIAMLPATIWGVMQFGIYSLVVVAATVLSCVLSEYAFETLMHKPVTISDGSAVVTGMILGLNMPPTIPLWMPVLGGVFAIIVVKQLYGGLGQNWMNPALAARCFLLISFAGSMTKFTDPVTDAIAGATPLAAIKAGGTYDVASMFIGKIPGTIGEVSVIALLIGSAYLLYKKVITIRIPGTYILTFAVFAFLFGQHNVSYVLAEVCGGGLVFGAFFMATDYVTSPITPKGQIVFGVCLGILTGLFRLFGGSAEGVSYAIIFCNMLVPLIEKYTLPTAFGKGGKKNGGK
ncbi:RnfABCDGE type electron transport complex subunit D [Lachnospiraceae bacterium 45-P1]